MRHVVTAEKENAGYLMRADNGEWLFEPKGTAEDRLAYRFGLSSAEIKDAMGQIAGNPYVLVNEPFQPEFPGGRTWNKFGAQLAVAPTYGGKHEHYDKILRHIGRGLDDAVQERSVVPTQRHGHAERPRATSCQCCTSTREAGQR